MGRSLHIYIEHRNLKIQKTLNDFFVQVWTFLLPLSLKVLRHKERGTIFLFWLFHLPSNTRGTRHKGLHEQAKVNCFVRCPVLNYWLFQNLPKSSARFRCVTSLALCSPVSHLGLLWHLWGKCLLSARVNTCFNVAPN